MDLHRGNPGPPPPQRRAAGAARQGALTAAIQLDLPEPLREAWGLRAFPDLVEIAPALASGTPGLAVSRLRIGRTLVDLAFRVRDDQAVVRIARRFGPPLAVRVRLRDARSVSTLVDEVMVGGDVASLLVEATHDVTFYLG